MTPRTGSNIEAKAKSSINGLIRQQRLESAGSQIRRIPNSDPEKSYGVFIPKGIKFSRLKTMEGRGVAVTGYLDACTHETAGKRIKRDGGIYKTSVSEQTDILVIGNLNPLYSHGDAGNKIINATKLNRSGDHKVHFMRLSNFLRMIGM
jgi:NAD-dependent DNA ligase